jgi:hypothetical protein
LVRLGYEPVVTINVHGDKFLSSLKTRLSKKLPPTKWLYTVSIKSFLDYKYLLQENYLEYKHIFLLILKLVSKKPSWVELHSEKKFVFHVVFL